MERASLRDMALQIFQRTLTAIDVEAVVRAHLRSEGEQLCVGDTRCDLRRIKRALIIAIGKASLPMARAARPLLGMLFHEGLIVTNETHSQPPAGFHLYLGGHPTPNQDSFNAAAHALELLRRYDSEDTLVLFLLSGGGSAMFELPIDPSLTLEDLQAVNRALVNCGAVIHEMNIVRRHLSAVKGGRLAAAAPRAQQISLYISDVNSDDLSTVASGPTLPSGATLADFGRVIERYNLLTKFPPRVTVLIKSCVFPALPTTQQIVRATHHLLLDNAIALQTAQRIAEEEFGCVAEIADDLIEGEVKTMARTHLQRLLALRAKHPGQMVCLLSGGEVICPVRGDGQGGRNQEFVLRAAMAMAEQQLDNAVCLSAGTDGIDGNSPAAGALADDTTLARALSLGLRGEEFLQNSDSFNFFNALGDALITGPTGNNVRDVRVFLARS
jgi:hydroxypyruvate reductase